MQAQAAAAQSRLAASARSSATLAGLPAITNAAAAGQARLAQATAAASTRQAALASTTKRVGDSTARLARQFQQAETSAGRFTRGTIAATAASTGLFRAVSFASGAFLVGALAGGAIGGAVEEFKQMTIAAAQTSALLEATGGVANVTAEQIDELAKSQLRLTGTDDELVKRAANVLLTFRNIRNEAGAMNDIFTRSVKAAQDISAIFGTDLSSTALQLGKALQDPEKGVTALRRSGITLSQSQRDLIKSLVESGRVLTAQKLILSEVERQVGGTAAAVGRTLPGQLAIAREESKNSLGELVKRISESRTAAEGLAATMGGLGDALKSTFAIARTGVGALIEITRTINDITRIGSVFAALGGLRSLVKTVATAAIVFGTLRLALGAATLAQTLYTRATTVAAAATAAEATAAAAATTRISLGAAALGALKGPLGITIALTAATIAAIRLKKALDQMPGTIRGFDNALDPLAKSLGRARTLQEQLAAASENVSLGRLDVQQAGRGVAGARRAIATTTAEPGSVQQQALAVQLTQAIQKQRDAEDALRKAEQARDRVQRTLDANERSRQFVIANTTSEIRKQIDTVIGLRQNLIKGGLGGGIRFSEDLPDVTEQIAKLTERLKTLASSGNPLKQAIAAPLLNIVSVLNRLPTRKEVTLVFKLAGQGKDAETIRQALGFGALDVPRPTVNAAQQASANILERQRGILGEIKRLQDLLTGGVVKEKQGLNEIVEQRKAALEVIRETVRSDREAVQAAKEGRESAIQGLADARRGLADAQQNLLDVIASSHQAIADAVRNSRQAITDAVQSAKENLTSLGDSVAQTLAKFFAAVGQGGGLTGKLGPQFQRLRDQILAGGAGAGTQGTAQRIASDIARTQKPVIDTEKIQRQFNDLTDAFDRGKISLPQFNKRLDALLKGVDFSKVSKTLGTAAANALRDQIADLRRQAQLITQSPQRELARQLVNPLKAVAEGAKNIASARLQATKDIAAARQGIQDADRGVQSAVKGLQRANQDLADAQRKLARDQIEEGKRNRAALEANTKQLKIRNQIEAERDKLNKSQKPKDKGKGAAATSSDTLVGAGAASP